MGVISSVSRTQLGAGHGIHYVLISWNSNRDTMIAVTREAMHRAVRHAATLYKA